MIVDVARDGLDGNQHGAKDVSPTPKWRGAAERFQKSLLTLLQALMLKVIEAEENEEIYKRSPAENLVAQVFGYWTEIHSCQNSLALAIELVRRAPSKRLNTTQAEYLRFCVESYFAEVYRLQERLVTCGTRLSRKFGLDRQWTSEFVQTIKDSLKDLSNARSKFVHESRFDDPQILETEGLEFLIAHGDRVQDSIVYARIAKRRLRALRKDWADRLQKHNERIGELLDQFFFVLDSALFDRNGNLKPPKS
jgi:hypothetical protein